MPHVLFGISGPPQAAGGARPARLTSLSVGAAFGSSSLLYIHIKAPLVFYEFSIK